MAVRRNRRVRADTLPKVGGAMVGIATAPISAKGTVLLVGVVERGGVVEGVLTTRVLRDGTDSTAKIAHMISRSRFSTQVKFVALDGISVAGLNVVDIRTLEKRLGVSCISITKRKPHKQLMKNAIRLYGERKGIDVSNRLDLLDATLDKPLSVSGMILLTEVQGPRRREILVRRAAEAVRLAHLIASGVSRKESKGRI